MCGTSSRNMSEIISGGVFSTGVGSVERFLKCGYMAS